MTALGFLYPGHSAEDDYPRIEQLLGSDIRLDLVHTGRCEDTDRAHPLGRLGAPEPLAAGVEELRLSGAEAIVWACTSGSFAYGWEGAHEQIRALAMAAGMPASSASFGFVHAVQEIGVHRVAIGAAYPDETAELFADFMRAAGVTVTGVRSSGTGTAAAAGGWGERELFELAGQADRTDAEALLLPNTALHTVAHLPALEKERGKPVLTANQVTVWEALRLTDRRVNAPKLGSLFTREPIIQV